MFPVMQLIEKLKMFVISKSDLLNPWGGDVGKVFFTVFLDSVCFDNGKEDLILDSGIQAYHDVFSFHLLLGPLFCVVLPKVRKEDN